MKTPPLDENASRRSEEAGERDQAGLVARHPSQAGMAQTEEVSAHPAE
jgi:hypothetical protein